MSQHFPSQGSKQRYFAFRTLILKNLKPSVICITDFHKALLTLTLEEEHGGQVLAFHCPATLFPLPIKTTLALM